jgi:hypothetical protein
MVSLLEIGPLTDTVQIRGTDLTVSGLTAKDLFDLMQEYPELQYVLAGQNLTDDLVKTLMGRASHTLGMIMAMGLNERGDNQTEVVLFAMTKLTAGEQADLITAIAKLTFPKGIKSFVESLQEAADSAGVHGKAPPTKSRGQSKGSSHTATTSEIAGATHPDNSQAGPS